MHAFEPKFPTRISLFQAKYCINVPVSTNSLLLFDLYPYSVAIAAYLVNIAHNMFLFRPVFHIYYIFELSFPTRPSLFKHNSAYIHPLSTNSIQLFDPTPLSMSISSYPVNIACIVLMVRLSLHSCYGYQHATSASHIFYWNESIDACVRFAICHIDVKCIKSYLQIAPISTMTALHASHVRLVHVLLGTIRPLVLSYMLYQRNEGRLKMEELVRPTTCSDLSYRYYPPDASV